MLCYATFDTIMRLGLNNQLSVSIYTYVTVWYRLRYAALYCDVVHYVMLCSSKEKQPTRMTSPATQPPIRLTIHPKEPSPINIVSSNPVFR